MDHEERYVMCNTDYWCDEEKYNKELKKILEEIYNKGYKDGFGYLIDGKGGR